MIFLLYGPDDYRRERKRREIIARIGCDDVTEVDMAEHPEGLLEFLRAGSLFGGSRVALVRVPFSGLSDAHLAKIYREHITRADSFLVLVDEAAKVTKRFAFLEDNPAHSFSFPILTGQPWKKFLIEIAGDASLRLSPKALSLCMTVFAGNSWAAVTEFARLRDAGILVVEPRHILALSRGGDMWRGLRALQSPDWRIRVAALEHIFAMGESAAKVFNIAASLGKKNIARFAAYDRAIKSGKLDYEEALVDLAIR